jgi:hypothetical protein
VTPAAVNKVLKGLHQILADQDVVPVMHPRRWIR